jgi:5-methyltetrahydrofolate corrinoid/iron sulfur protein methyltransferase
LIIIGERINATRKSIREAILSRDKDIISKEIHKQDEAGADYIDLNAGTGVGTTEDEIKHMRWLVDIALAETEKKLAVDSADLVVLKNTAEYIDKRRPWLLNSVKSDPVLLDSLLPLAAEHNVPVIALAMDKTGIPREASKRIEILHTIVEAADAAGVSQDKFFFDPLVMPISADITQGAVTMQTLEGTKKHFPAAKTTMGLSNASHGLPERARINRAFLIAAISHGLDSVICDPLDRELRNSILLGELVTGKDRYCRKFTRAVRKGDFS